MKLLPRQLFFVWIALSASGTIDCAGNNAVMKKRRLAFAEEYRGR